jgi:predicted RNase H-like nuclease (RuvC/YqgF family)
MTADRAALADVERRAVEAFVKRVNARAEADMLAGNPVTGAHHRAIETEFRALQRQVDAYAEKEAACCPEDVGFPEYIASLQRQAETLREALAACKREVEALQHVIDCANTPLMRDVMAERDEAYEHRGAAMALIAQAQEGMFAAQRDRDSLQRQVETLREALECARHELALWVQTYGERGPTRFVMGSIDHALASTAPKQEARDAASE